MKKNNPRGNQPPYPQQPAGGYPQQPVQPGQPMQPHPQPTQPAQPMQPHPQPTQPAQPMQQRPQPAQPAQPMQPRPQPAQPTQPVQPRPQPAQPAQPAQPRPQPAQPAQPAQPRPQPTPPLATPASTGAAPVMPDYPYPGQRRKLGGGSHKPPVAPPAAAHTPAQQPAPQAAPAPAPQPAAKPAAAAVAAPKPAPKPATTGARTGYSEYQPMTETGRAAVTPAAAKPPKQKKKRKWYDFVIIAAIVLLLGAAVYLLVKPRIVHHNQQTIASELLNLAPIHNEIKPSDTLPEGILVDPEANKVDGEDWEVFAKGQETYTKGQKVMLHPIGRLQIDSIDLSLPILDKSGLVELRYGIGLYQPSAPLYSKDGISVLFGHHMIERGHYFNRLEELKIGDRVRVLGNGHEYTYTVDKRLIIQPEEMVPLLTQSSKDKYLLMITCVNPPNFDQRLLVYAKLTDVQPLDKGSNGN